MRFIFILILLMSVTLNGFSNQEDDSVKVKSSIFFNRIPKKMEVIDSAVLLRNNLVRDSITWYFLKPDSKRVNLFVEDLLSNYVIEKPYLLSFPKNNSNKINNYGIGNHLDKKPKWFLLAILFIIVLFAIVKIVFAKEVDIIFKAFYDKRVLHQVNREENVFVTWHFLFLFIIFSFTLGLVVCILMFKTKASDRSTDFSIFLLTSCGIFAFFGIKIFIIRFLSFMFQVNKLAKEYTNLIYISYFNSLFLLLPLTFCMAFISFQEGYTFVIVGLVIFSVIIGFQFIRSAINILLNYRLSKFYLILYLCTLEICPVLIFAKIINTNL